MQSLNVNNVKAVYPSEGCVTKSVTHTGTGLEVTGIRYFKKFLSVLAGLRDVLQDVD